MTFIASLLVAGSAVELSATPLHDTTEAVVLSIPQTERSTSPESHIESYSPTSGLSVEVYSSQGIAPVVRDLQRNSRQTSRLDIRLAAVRSIDSTQAKSRAGLFNHKILFYTHPRHYYLNGLVRLII